MIDWKQRAEKAERIVDSYQMTLDATRELLREAESEKAVLVEAISQALKCEGTDLLSHDVAFGLQEALAQISESGDVSNKEQDNE